jgi:hypothetical protein
MLASCIAFIFLLSPLCMPEQCPSDNGPFSTSGHTLVGSGATQAQALADLYAEGGDKSLVALSGISCSACETGGPCEVFVGLSGVIGTPSCKVRRNEAGEIIEWIAMASFAGSYTVDCVGCE